jgi:SAM-dependent methyltransferase
MSPGLSPRLAAIVDALPLQPHSRVLEIGCGPGAAARAVATRLAGGHILAIDRSASAIAQARAAAAEEIAAGRMSVRQVPVEEFVRRAGEERTTSYSPSASGPSTVVILRLASGRSSVSPRRRQLALGCSSTAATRFVS